MARHLVSAAAIFILVAVAAAQTTQPGAAPRFGLYEVVLTSDANFNNPFWDAKAQAVFTSPAGKTVQVEGFYYGPKEWRVRLAPREEGTWKYQATLKGKPVEGAEVNVKTDGAFECKGQQGHGFLKLSKLNPYRMEYEDGKAFYGVGIQTCGVIQKVDLDGPEAGQGWRTATPAEWCKEFQDAVNLVRIQLGQGNTSGLAVPMIPPPTLPGKDKTQDNPRYAEVLPEGVPDRYDLDIAAKLDDVYRLHRAAGFSQILILMQDMSAFGRQKTAFGFNTNLDNYKSVAAESLPLQEKYIRYLVARYGCFVDIWEMFNEDSYAPEDYLAHLHKVIRQADPYGHIITSNFSSYDQPFCEIITPHEYVSIPAKDIDVYLSKQIAAYKSFGKPVQYTEFGNKSNLSNYDPVKWRLALWTAYMNECGMLYWSQSGSKTLPRETISGNSNTYIGPDTRQHFRAFFQIAGDLPIDMRPRYVYPGYWGFRGYALGNGKFSIVYLHHYEDHAKELKLADGIMVDTGPGNFRCAWFDPASGKALGEPRDIVTRQRFSSLLVPPFTIDVVCRVERQDQPASAKAAGAPAAGQD